MPGYTLNSPYVRNRIAQEIQKRQEKNPGTTGEGNRGFGLYRLSLVKRLKFSLEHGRIENKTIFDVSWNKVIFFKKGVLVNVDETNQCPNCGGYSQFCVECWQCMFQMALKRSKTGLRAAFTHLMHYSMFLNFIALNLILGVFTGCNVLHKLNNTDSTPGQVNTLPADYTVTGTVLNSVVQPIRCAGSKVTAQIKIPGAIDFRDVSSYEMQCLGEGDQGFVQFGNSEVLPLPNGKLWLTGKPVTPSGTEYKIRSVLNAANSLNYSRI